MAKTRFLLCDLYPLASKAFEFSRFLKRSKSCNAFGARGLTPSIIQQQEKGRKANLWKTADFRIYIVYNSRSMKKLLSRFILSFFSNLVALWAAVYFVKGFQINLDFLNFLKVAGLFTLLNIFIRPIFTLILSPIIFITFGLGIILVHMLMLYLIGLFPLGVTTTGLPALFYATLIIGFVNILIHFGAKGLYKE